MAKKVTARFSLPWLLVIAASLIIFWQRAGMGTPQAGQGKKSLPPPGTYAIDHFIDGDTISVRMNGTATPVRFIGVDTPETHKPNTPVQCFGERAAAFTKAKIGEGGSVRLVADSLSENRDRYNRLLRYVYLPDGTNLDELLVRAGYGFAYVQFPFDKSAAFTADQQTAQQQRAGLWGACRPFQESSGRWQTETAAINSS